MAQLLVPPERSVPTVDRSQQSHPLPLPMLPTLQGLHTRHQPQGHGWYVSCCRFFGSLLCPFCLGTSLSSLGVLTPAGLSPLGLFCSASPCPAQLRPPLCPCRGSCGQQPCLLLCFPSAGYASGFGSYTNYSRKKSSRGSGGKKILSRLASEPGRWQVGPEESCAAG